ncbi:hypothetical protein M5D96_002067 [Drosophila gunungcola]|uniref:Uncharacterized protein n=1 Tax=Drosophila gunungcola TaxID=103775 RepID=A0A9P9Z028_9MUSC|nr:hypothetical protein M5D96_002067 [Drosophila gunungcola]
MWATWGAPRPSTRSRVLSANTDPCATFGWPAILRASPSWNSRTGGTRRMRSVLWTEHAVAAQGFAWRCHRGVPVATGRHGAPVLQTAPVRHVVPVLPAVAAIRAIGEVARILAIAVNISKKKKKGYNLSCVAIKP